MYSSPNILNPNYKGFNPQLQPFSPKEIVTMEDEDYIPSKQRLSKTVNRTNVYLKRVNFRKDISEYLFRNFKNDIDYSIANKVTERILNNIYFEEQLERSDKDNLSESLKIEIDRLFNSNVDINTIKNLVSKYF